MGWTLCSNDIFCRVRCSTKQREMLSLHYPYRTAQLMSCQLLFFSLDCMCVCVFLFFFILAVRLFWDKRNYIFLLNYSLKSTIIYIVVINNYRSLFFITYANTCTHYPLPAKGSYPMCHSGFDVFGKDPFHSRRKMSRAGSANAPPLLRHCNARARFTTSRGVCCSLLHWCLFSCMECNVTFGCVFDRIVLPFFYAHV